MEVLYAFLKLTKYLVGLDSGAPLLKQLFDNILFNPALWIYSAFDVSLVSTYVLINRCGTLILITL